MRKLHRIKAVDYQDVSVAQTKPIRSRNKASTQVKSGAGLDFAPFAFIGAVAVGLFAWALYSGEPAGQRSYLYDTPTPVAEAAYCVAVAQRSGELTHGLGEVRFEWYLRELTEYWIARVANGGRPVMTYLASPNAVATDMARILADGRTRLARDSQARDVNEQAHLHLALQRCGERALAQGERLRSME
jgi:hypothetical protein